jgi:hypothetical protein
MTYGGRTHVLVSMEKLDDVLTSVRFSWNQDVIDELKSSIPWQDRSWDKSAGAWFVKTRFAEGLATRLRGMGHTVTVEDKRPAPEPPKSVATAAWVSALFDAVGPDRAQPVYKALVRVLHPDNPTTGDTGLAQALTRGYDEVSRRR